MLIPQVMAPVENDQADYVQGSRFLEGGTYENLPKFRYLMVKVHAFVFFVLTGFRGTDALNGFRAFRVSLFSDKVASLCFAESRGVSTLPFGIVSNHPELLAEAKHIGFPLTIRPLGTTARLLGKKALIISEADKLSAQLGEWPKGHKLLLLQHFVDRFLSNVHWLQRSVYHLLHHQVSCLCDLNHAHHLV